MSDKKKLDDQKKLDDKKELNKMVQLKYEDMRIIFDLPIRSLYGCRFTTESLYSTSSAKQAKAVVSLIEEVGKQHKEFNIEEIIDATANIGGNFIELMKIPAEKYTAIELDEVNYTALKINVRSALLFMDIDDKVSMLNMSCMKYKYSPTNTIFIDPPWGGVDYKSADKIELYLDGGKFSNVFNKLAEKVQLIIAKLPYNYNVSLLKSGSKIVDIVKPNGNKMYILVVYYAKPLKLPESIECDSVPYKSFQVITL